MYQLKYKDYILYHPRLTEQGMIVRKPSVKLSVSKAGSMSFIVDNDHPYLSDLQRMNGVLELLDGSLPIYRGRITKDTVDFYKAHKIETEGMMACLNDSIIKPFAYPDDFAEDADYKTAAASGNVVEYLFRWFLIQHNAQVSAEQQILPGVCTVTDPNNYITRSSEDYMTTMETIRGKLSESSLGGYLLIRYEDDGNYLDYYAELPLTNTQPVEFAANLLDLTSEVDGAEIYTAILPEGKDGLTLESLPDGALTDDLVKDGLTIYSKSGVATYGRITRHIKWDDVTVAENLRTKAKAALLDSGLSMPETITCKAVDLGWQDTVQHFRVGRMTMLASTPHGYSASYPLMELSPDILDPGNTKITMGATRRTYTGSQLESTKKVSESIVNVRANLTKKIDDIEVKPGPAGASVWITYHDGTDTPDVPTGDGTQGGWHTDLTASVVWMSQKVAASATDGTWGAPIRILGETGATGAQGKPGKDGTDGKDGTNGKDGTDGVSVTATTVEYYLSTSDTELSGGTWGDAAPEITDGTYLWSRTKITYSDGDVTYTGAYCISKAMTESAKPLITETRTAVTELSQEVDKFKLDVAETYAEKSEFNTFRQSTEANIEVNSQAITQQYSEIKSVEETVKGIDGQVKDVTAKVTATEGYIKTGKIAEDENQNPLYGVEVGQTGADQQFLAFARFLANKIAFLDTSGHELSYFSGQKYYISDAVILNNLNLGGYEMSTKKGITIRWAGR
nr:MAG TPA: endopeptidase tail [Caudoviricetes sp.]